MSTKHKHADLIIKWALGTEIEVYLVRSKKWGLCEKPEWNENSEYRIKKKPDIVAYANIETKLDPIDLGFGSSLCGLFSTSRLSTDNIRLTYCGETGKLLSMEMIEQE